MTWACVSGASERALHWTVREEEDLLVDVVFTLVTVAFFAIAILYLRGCERLK